MSRPLLPQGSRHFATPLIATLATRSNVDTGVAMTRVDPEIAWYYGKGREAARLATNCQLEEARTRRIIARRLHESSQAIIDIGGGAGAYAFWLTELGHTVSLVEPIDLHLEQAQAQARSRGVALGGIHKADARSLPFRDETFDVALSLGPLYHIPERPGRVKALQEAYRVLRPGGILFAAAIGRYSMAVDGFFKGLIADPVFVETMRDSTRYGQHRNPTRKDGLFTTSYFHRPGELHEEVTESGFRDVELLVIEGPWTCVPEFARKWQSAEFRSFLMEVIEEMEADPAVIGLGGHIMAVGRKNG